ncbi:MAG TPA: GAF domain-containing protein [Pyrinomonadaceae bacterium]|nr:GAF domain-containing protein [Pyrinomonadaceae bacterium]
MAGDNSSPEKAGEASVASHHVIESSRIITETASDAIITIDTASTILFVNRAAENIFGYSREEMTGSNLTMLMPDYLRHLHRQGLQNYIETGRKHIAWDAVELPGLHKSGKEITLELSFGEFNKDGVRFFTGIARDISRRKCDERRLALQHSVAEILAGAANIEEASPKLLREIACNLDWQVADFWLVDKSENVLRLISNWRDPSLKDIEEFEATNRAARFPPGGSFPGKIWLERQPIWVADFGKDNFPRSPSAARGNLHSTYGFPIILGDQVYGVIELFSVDNRDADPLILDTLVAIGSQIGQFLDRKGHEARLVNALAHAEEARLEAENLTKRLNSLQRLTDAALARYSVGEVIAESLNRVREVLNVDTVAILLLEKEGDELVAWAAQGLEEEVELGVRIPVGKGFAGRVVAENKPKIIKDVDHADVYNPLIKKKRIKSLLGVPLMIEGRPIGVLHVGKLQTTDFTQENVRLLELAADRIALAIENARLHEEQTAALAEAEAANKAKDEFLTILSHELRTPLTPIIGWLHMMQNGILKEADITKVLAVMNRNAYSLKRLINDLLDMSAILSGKMRIEETDVSVASVLEESVDTMSPYASDSKVQLTFQGSDTGATQAIVIGDRSRLNQAFCNLLHNAIKFSGPGSKVQVTLDSNDDQVVVQIQDQGEGIPDEFLPFVFDRFRQADGSRTRAYGGLGLGLALVKSFVEAHGGTIEASSDGDERGSTFTVTLPRKRTEVRDSHDRPALSAGENTIHPARILIVEDQPDTLEMLTAVFERHGYQVIGCDSGQQALELVASEAFDVLVSDVGMPTMDGLQLIKSLRDNKDLERIPAIALTGYASRHDSEAALKAGFDLHLSKPVDPTELTEAVERLLIAQQTKP